MALEHMRWGTCDGARSRNQSDQTRACNFAVSLCFVSPNGSDSEGRLHYIDAAIGDWRTGLSCQALSVRPALWRVLRRCIADSCPSLHLADQIHRTALDRFGSAAVERYLSS